MDSSAAIDDLTGLQGRGGWLEKAQSILSSDESHKVIFYIDLDRFKFVNDSLGHDAGDVVLRKAAETLITQVAPELDLVGRMGGDEFVILLTSPLSVARAEDIANNIIHHLSQPISIDTSEVEIGASIGISHYPKDSTSLEELLKFSDLAMYRAKHSGRNQQVTFHELMIKKIKYRREIQTYIRKALKEGTLNPVFQPIIDTRKQQMVSVELRIDCNESDGLYGLEQEELFNIADESQVAVELGEWMFDQSLQFLIEMQEAQEEIEIITPIRPGHFQQKNFVSWLSQRLEEAQVPPEHLVLQFSDQVFNSMRFPVQRRLHALSNLGVLIAVQNFGTGQLSPMKLHDWPISQVHLSYAFVSEMTVKNSIASMTAALIQMGLMLNKQVVACGVSSLEQQAMLYSHQCYLMQGPLFGENLTQSELEKQRFETLNDLNYLDDDYLDDMDEF